MKRLKHNINPVVRISVKYSKANSSLWKHPWLYLLAINDILIYSKSLISGKLQFMTYLRNKRCLDSFSILHLHIVLMHEELVKFLGTPMTMKRYVLSVNIVEHLKKVKFCVRFKWLSYFIAFVIEIWCQFQNLYVAGLISTY